MIRWPGKIPAGTILNDMMSHEDWVPTLMSAAGRPTVTEELKAGVNINGRGYHNHLDGYDCLISPVKLSRVHATAFTIGAMTDC